MKHSLKLEAPFVLELGGVLNGLEITYHTYGTLNDNGDNVIWVCHALTASSDVADWWSGLVGEGKVMDTNQYFLVCANILGSCYGSTGPTGQPLDGDTQYGIDFPKYTIRDMVAAHQLLQQHLGISSIRLLVGGSMGGYQALEWSLMVPNDIAHLFLIATSAEESAWGKAIHMAQRMAIAACPGWELGIVGSGDSGLKAARAIGMLSYRNYELYKEQQKDHDVNLTEGYKAASYIQYQAQKLADRFDALTYYKLTEALDTHQVARGRYTSLEAALQQVLQPTLVIGISSDILCPPVEQQFLATNIPNATFQLIDSHYGHDGFLVEYEKVGAHLKAWIDINGI